jgi:uncharacterized damage-inducible protein DinB
LTVRHICCCRERSTHETLFLDDGRDNTWANLRLYKMAGALPEKLYRREVGVYLKSLHGTLDHLLVTDRIWMRRLTGEGSHPQ